MGHGLLQDAQGQRAQHRVRLVRHGVRVVAGVTCGHLHAVLAVPNLGGDNNAKHRIEEKDWCQLRHLMKILDRVVQISLLGSKDELSHNITVGLGLQLLKKHHS